jgi:D-alanyl-lipoteichoic acid acyltransferase DltB (MBOAT superfamily)
MRNFDAPYVSVGPQDFWRRWHISLSTWLRDYLYVSLGGNRKGKLRTYVNLMATMVLGGLWHGASWNFVLWGFFHGSMLGVERATGLTSVGLKAWWSRALRVVVFFQLTLFGWLLFRLHSAKQIGATLTTLATGSWAIDGRAERWLEVTAVLCVPMLVAWLVRDRVKSAGNVARFAFAVVVIAALFVFRVQQRIEFIYFQF